MKAEELNRQFEVNEEGNIPYEVRENFEKSRIESIKKCIVLTPEYYSDPGETKVAGLQEIVKKLQIFTNFKPLRCDDFGMSEKFSLRFNLKTPEKRVPIRTSMRFLPADADILIVTKTSKKSTFYQGGLYEQSKSGKLPGAKKASYRLVEPGRFDKMNPADIKNNYKTILFIHDEAVKDQTAAEKYLDALYEAYADKAAEAKAKKEQAKTGNGQPTVTAGTTVPGTPVTSQI